jgi:O-succinylbenzoic acid--CoA ligase
LHTLGNHYYSALGSNANIKLDPGDRWLHSLPLHHVGGISILFRVLLSRTTLALPETTAPLGESITLLEATHISLVATQLRRMLAEDDVPAGLKAILMGASAMPPGLIHEAHSRGLPLHTSYGQTEMASQVSATVPDASLEQLKTSGCVLPHRELRVDEDGEILVRGETLFTGYVEGDKIIRPLDADGWFHTKDLGRQTSDGSLIVHGRKDNLFISGGENIQPEEIEEAFLDLPGVSEAVVVDIPDPEFGYRAVAFVRCAGTDTSMNLQEELYRVLPRFKVPKTIHAWPADAPEGMKVDRSFMRDRALRLSGEG